MDKEMRQERLENNDMEKKRSLKSRDKSPEPAQLGTAGAETIPERFPHFSKFLEYTDAS